MKPGTLPLPPVPWGSDRKVYFQIPQGYLLRLLSVSSQKFPWGAITTAVPRHLFVSVKHRVTLRGRACLRLTLSKTLHCDNQT